MKLTLIMTGKTGQSWLVDGMNEYIGRLGHYIPLTIIETPGIRKTRSMPEQEQKNREGEQIIRQIPKGNTLILLDDKGKKFTSEGFAGYMQKKMNEGRDICMVTGGAYGFSDDLYHMAEMNLSLSLMTFSHQMVRLILLEQLYRAFTIIRGEPYHHS